MRMHTTLKGRARRALAVAGAGIALVALAGCNPLEADPTVSGRPDFALFQYDGPTDVWFEAAVSGAEGVGVSFEGAVHVPDPATNTEHRRCRNNINRAVEEPCALDYPEFPNTKAHLTWGEAPGTYWPMIVLHPGDQFLVDVSCTKEGAGKDCPASTRIHVRTTGDGGALVGDIKQITAFGRS